jgi:uncharacterized membrane protein
MIVLIISFIIKYKYNHKILNKKNQKYITLQQYNLIIIVVKKNTYMIK